MIGTNELVKTLHVNRVFNWNYEIRREYGQHINIAVNQGGTSSGKTYAIIQLLFVLCANGEIMAEFQDESHFGKPVRVRVVSEALTALKLDALDIARQIYNSTFAAFGVTENRSECKFIFPNGSQMIFLGLQEIEKAKKGKYHYTYVSEATSISYAVFDQIHTRTTVFTFIDYNPSRKFWAHIHLLDPKGELHKFAKCIRSTYKDNEENLEAQTINTILHKASKSDNWRRVYLEGKLGRLETLVFPNYEVIDKRPDNRLLKHHTLGLDFGVNDPTTLVLTADYYNERGERLGVYVEELFYKRGLNTIGIIDNIIHATQEWREILLGEREFLIIYADSAGKLTIDDITPTINQYKIKVFAADKSNGSVGRGILHLQSEGIYINRKSLNAIEEFSGYEFIKNRDGNITDCPIDKDNHVIDAVRYSRKDRMQQWAIEHGLKIKEQLEK